MSRFEERYSDYKKALNKLKSAMVRNFSIIAFSLNLIL